MKPKAMRYLIYGQVCFYLGLFMCILIRPNGLGANEGISYYGVYKTTVVPYIVTLLGPAYFCIKAAEELRHSFILKYSLTAIGLLAMGVMATPDTFSHFVDSLHVACGSALFVTQLLLSIWLVIKLDYKRWAVVLCSLELIGGIASFIFLEPAKGLLLQSQAVFQFSFGALIIWALHHYSERLGYNGVKERSPRARPSQQL